MLGPIKRAIPTGQFGRAVAVLAGSTLIAQLINLALSPVFTRLYVPAAFGAFAVFGALLALWNVASSLCYEMAIPMPDRDEDAASAASVAGINLIAMTVICGVFVAIFGRSVATLFHAPAVAGYLWFLPLGVLTVGIYRIFYFWALRKRKFSALARTRVTQSVSRSVVQVALGVWRASPLGLIIGQIVGGAWGISTLVRAAWPDRAVVASVSRVSLADSVRRYSKFPKFALAAGMVNSLALQAPSLFVARTYGLAIAGLYALTDRVTDLPMMVVGVAVSESFLGVAPKLAREDPVEFRRLFLLTARRLLLVAIMPTLLLMALGPMIFQIVFGHGWRTAGLYAAIWAPAMLVQFAVSPLTKVSYILERQSLQLGLDGVRFGTLATVMIVITVLHLATTTAMVLMSAAVATCYLIAFAFYYRLIHTYRLADEAEAAPKFVDDGFDVNLER